MRNNLGKVFLTVFIFLQINVFASTYIWSAHSNKSVAMVNEAIYLKYVCEYSDEAELYTIEFNPVTDNEKYKIQMLSETEKIKDAKKINTFEFIAFVKESGRVEFVFDTIMEKTNKDSIQNTVLGRDNADYEEFTKKIIRQKAVIVDINPSESDLVGEFELTAKKKTNNVKAYEPYNLEISIDGYGNFDSLKPILFSIEGVKIFSQKIITDIKLTKDGYIGRWSQKFAFVSKKDFVIPEFNIEYFDLKEKKYKNLKMSKLEVKVTPSYKKEELLDKMEEKYEFSYDFLYYILTFLAGYLVSKIEFKRVEKEDVKNSSFSKKVQNAKSLDELMMLLVMSDSKKYEKLILDVEAKKITSLTQCKKEIRKIY